MMNLKNQYMKRGSYNPNNDMWVARIVAFLAIVFLLYSFHYGDGGIRCDAVGSCIDNFNPDWID